MNNQSLITLWVRKQVHPNHKRRPKTTSNPRNSPSIARTFCRREMERAAKSQGKMKKKKSSGKEIVVVTKSKQEKKKSEIKTSSRSPREPVVLLLSSSSSSGDGDSQKVIEIEGEDDETKRRVTNRSTKSSKIKNANNAKRKGKDGDFDGEGEEDGTACRFPMARIKRIIKSEDSDSLLSQDVVFLVNKATVLSLSFCFLLLTQC